MEKKWLVCVFFGWWLVQGCDSEEGGFAALARADAGVITFTPTYPVPSVITPEWAPHSHPVGTLLEDRLGELWMVTSDGRRVLVTGDDLLGEVSLDDGDAILMSAEEERCLVADASELWHPDILDWGPYYGYGEDENLYVLNDVTWERRLTTPEAMRSWGRNPDWIDWFDFSERRWLMYHDVDPPFGLRDGTLVRTEFALYYVARGRSYVFMPEVLATEAGYHPEEALEMDDARLRELAPVAFAITRESFEHCPVEDGS